MDAPPVAHPGRATLRAAVAAAVGLFPLLNGILAVRMNWLAENTPIIPEWLYVVLNGVLVAAIALTALVTRILAVSGVVEWTRKNLSSLPPTVIHPAGTKQCENEAPHPPREGGALLSWAPLNGSICELVRSSEYH